MEPTEIFWIRIWRNSRAENTNLKRFFRVSAPFWPPKDLKVASPFENVSATCSLHTVHTEAVRNRDFFKISWEKKNRCAYKVKQTIGSTWEYFFFFLSKMRFADAFIFCTSNLFLILIAGSRNRVPMDIVIIIVVYLLWQFAMLGMRKASGSAVRCNGSSGLAKCDDRNGRCPNAKAWNCCCCPASKTRKNCFYFHRSIIGRVKNANWSTSYFLVYPLFSISCDNYRKKMPLKNVQTF